MPVQGKNSGMSGGMSNLKGKITFENYHISLVAVLFLDLINYLKSSPLILCIG
jgi:hypothetical protein